MKLVKLVIVNWIRFLNTFGNVLYYHDLIGPRRQTRSITYVK